MRQEESQECGLEDHGRRLSSVNGGCHFSLGRRSGETEGERGGAHPADVQETDGGTDGGSCGGTERCGGRENGREEREKTMDAVLPGPLLGFIKKPHRMCQDVWSAPVGEWGQLTRHGLHGSSPRRGISLVLVM